MIVTDEMVEHALDGWYGMQWRNGTQDVVDTLMVDMRISLESALYVSPERLQHRKPAFKPSWQDRLGLWLLRLLATTMVTAALFRCVRWAVS
jgi:hypothetical protein